MCGVALELVPKLCQLIPRCPGRSPAQGLPAFHQFPQSGLHSCGAYIWQQFTDFPFGNGHRAACYYSLHPGFFCHFPAGKQGKGLFRLTGAQIEQGEENFNKGPIILPLLYLPEGMYIKGIIAAYLLLPGDRKDISSPLEQKPGEQISRPPPARGEGAYADKICHKA